LNDSQNDRWTVEFHLNGVNEAQREIVKLDLSANAVRENLKLVEGVHQALPADSLGLVAIVRNMGQTGYTPGKRPYPVTRKFIEDMFPDWYEQDADVPVLFYSYSKEDERYSFDVFPPAPAPGLKDWYVEIKHGEIPATISESGSILNDRYDLAIIEYLLYRAKSKLTETQSVAEAVLHLERFEKLVISRV